MNSDNMMTTTINNIEAVFEHEVKSFTVSPNYTSLVDSLKKSFGEFGGVYVLDNSGVFVPVSSDADLALVKQKIVGDSLRVFLVHAGDGSKYLSRKFLTKWMTKHASGSIPFAQPVVATLVKEGFRPRDIKKNFNVVLENAGDVDLTLAVFHSLCQVKNKCLKRNSSYTEEPRKKRRYSRGERKHDKESDQMVDVPPASARTGQTHGLAKEFLELAVTAYPEDAGQKVLTKQFTKIILDGNNMLFVTSGLRGLTLSKQRVKAEKMLSIAALAFSQIVGITTEVVFDQTKLPKSNSGQAPVSQPEISLVNSSLSEFNTKISQIASSFPVLGIPLVFPNGTVVSVSAARPEFATTDDKLIAWARSNSQKPVATTTTTTSTSTATTTTSDNSSNAVSTSSTASITVPNSSILVISSDRALAGELCSLGVPLMKPGTWICLFSSLFSTSELSKDTAIAWFDNWVAGVVK